MLYDIHIHCILQWYAHRSEQSKVMRSNRHNPLNPSMTLRTLPLSPTRAQVNQRLYMNNLIRPPKPNFSLPLMPYLSPEGPTMNAGVHSVTCLGVSRQHYWPHTVRVSYKTHLTLLVSLVLYAVDQTVMAKTSYNQFDWLIMLCICSSRLLQKYNT